MREIKMQKKFNSGLLNSDFAVEDFLDTLLQESTGKPESVKPVQQISNLQLFPDLETGPFEPVIEVDPDALQLEEVKLETVEQALEKVEISEQALTQFNHTFPVQCLMFSVAGNQLSIPLINLGGVVTRGKRLTLLPGNPDWFLGILQHREINVKVVDTAKILQVNSKQHSEYQHILIFGDDNWAITCDELGKVIKLNEDDVKWTKPGSKNLFLGTIKDSLSILLDPVKILTRLNRHDGEACH